MFEWITIQMKGTIFQLYIYSVLCLCCLISSSIAKHTERKRQKVQRLGVEDDGDQEVATEERAGPSNTAKRKGKDVKQKLPKKGKQAKKAERRKDNDPDPASSIAQVESNEDSDTEYEASTEAESDGSKF